jgi:CelD/BcsL family acetyltransferase involved in cellulose biosynthesis
VALLVGSLIEDPAELEPLEGEWDDLAVAAGAPFGAPAWALAWWRHLAPRRSSLCVVSVRDGDELIGLAPFFAKPRFGTTEIRLLSGGLASRLGILARLGAEPEVAAAVAEVLGESDLQPDSFHWESVDAGAGWAELISAGWPDSGEHRVREESERSAPVLRLAGSYDEWLASKSRNFRQQLRRKRKALEAAGASFRSTDRASLRADLEAFQRLHFGRWEDRGGSAVPEGAIAMLAEAGERLLEQGRFRMTMIDGPGGDAVCAQIFVAAGGEVAYWSIGFDEGWAKHSPGILSTVEGIRDAFERGDRLFDFGGGEAEYKRRLTDDDRPVAWRTSYPAGTRYPLARLWHLPKEMARRGSAPLREAIGPERVNRLRGLISR